MNKQSEKHVHGPNCHHGDEGSHSLPKIDFTTFVLSVASAAFMGLGVEIPGSGEKGQVDLNLAKQNIDLLEMFQEKTQGNRNPEEDQLLSEVLYQTRMKYVEVKKEHEHKHA